MNETSFQRNTLQKDYIHAYHASKLVWYGLRTDDELSRIPEREEYVEEVVGAQFPHIHKSDLLWLGNLAHSSIIEQLYPT
jgi:hypothetical protein